MYRSGDAADWEQYAQQYLCRNCTCGSCGRKLLLVALISGQGAEPITEMMEAYNQPEDIADAAIHFALLAYAAEVASSRYVALLRRQRQPEEPKKPQKVSRKERRKQEKEAAEDA